MATSKVKADVQTTIPASWGAEGEDFQGRKVTDKATLVGTPFMIIGYEVIRSGNGRYDTMFVSALDTEGNEFEFSDSSNSGVKADIQKLAVEKGLDPAAGGGWISYKLRCWDGLRVNVRDVEDEDTGKVRKDVATYYLAGRGIKRNV